jgi:hypothetical protein
MASYPNPNGSGGISSRDLGPGPWLPWNPNINVPDDTVILDHPQAPPASFDPNTVLLLGSETEYNAAIGKNVEMIVPPFTYMRNVDLSNIKQQMENVQSGATKPKLTPMPEVHTKEYYHQKYLEQVWEASRPTQLQNTLLVGMSLGLAPLALPAIGLGAGAGAVGTSLPGFIVPMGAGAAVRLGGGSESTAQLVEFGTGFGIGMLGGVGRNISTRALIQATEQDIFRACFAPGTRVVVPPAPGEQDYRTRAIEELAAGDLVLAKDPETGGLGWQTVVRPIRKTSDHLRLLRVRSAGGDQVQEIKTTDWHVVWAVGRGWLMAGELEAGDLMVQPDGGWARVEATARVPYPGGIAVHNIEVDRYHTYFVAAEGAQAPPVWVHNEDCAEILNKLIMKQNQSVRRNTLQRANVNPVTGSDLERAGIPRMSAEEAFGGKSAAAYSGRPNDVGMHIRTRTLYEHLSTDHPGNFVAGHAAANAAQEGIDAEIRALVEAGNTVQVRPTVWTQPGTQIGLAMRYQVAVNGKLTKDVMFNLATGAVKNTETFFKSGGKWLAATQTGDSSANDLADRALLAAILNDVAADWQADLPGAVLPQVHLAVQDLPAGELGEAVIDAVGADGLPTAGTIVLSPSAAGVGWFVGSAPPAAGEYDLETVLLHEEGHLLGFNPDVPGFAAHVGTVAGSQVFVGPDFTAQLTPAPDDDHLDANAYPNDLMNATLSPGVRRLPSPLDVQILDTVRGDSSALAAATANSSLDPVGAVFGLWSSGGPDGVHNGDFSVTDPASPAFAWTAKGSVAVANHAATLTENPNVFSGLTQTFTVPAGATALRFTVAGNFAANGLGPPDAFEAALLDPSTGASLVGSANGLSKTDAFFNLQTSGKAFFGPETSVVGVPASGQAAPAGSPLVVTVSLQGLAAGTQAVLHLDLLGFGPAGSSARITNVQLLGPEGNHSPVANPDTYTTRQGQALQVGAAAGVLANDTDAENDPLTAQLVSQPAHGSVTLNPDGSFLYTPAAGFGGPDTFTYKASDGQALSQATTVTVIVDNPPVVTSSNLFLSSPSVNEGGSVSLTGAFSDVKTQAHTVTIDWGDGSTPDTLSLPAGATAIPATSHTYRDEPANGPAYHITVTVNDGLASASAGVDVPVNNVTPVVAAMPDVVINQGDTLRSPGSFFDPSNDTWTATADYGDGSGVQPLTLNADKTFTLDHTYLETGVFTVTVTVRDDEGVAGTTTQTVAVTNGHPVVLAGPDVQLNEGDTLTRGGRFFGAPGDTFTATVDYGDGSGAQPLAFDAGRAFTLSHTYGATGSYPVTVTVTNQAGDTAAGHFTVTVVNVAPAVTLGPSVTINQGDTLQSAGSFTDPGLRDSWTATVDYGDGSGAQPLALNADKTFDLRHAYFHPGSDTVTVTVTDRDGGVGTATLAVTVNAVPLAAVLGGDVTLNEGDTLSTTGHYTAPPGATTTATVDYGDGLGERPLTLNADGTFALSHLYPLHGLFTVTVRLSDSFGDTASAQLHVTVNNVPPAVSLAGEVTLNEGDTLVTGGHFTDPGAESWAATVDFGDGGGAQPLTLNADKTFALSHAYPRDGDYTVTVTVRDDGAVPGVGRLLVHVREVNPAVSLGGPVVLNEGGSLVRGGTFFDPGADTWTATVDYGDGARPLDLLPDHSFRLDHLYPRFGTFQVTVRVTDQDGNTGSATLSVRVNDVPPLIGMGGSRSIFEGEKFAADGSFQDPGLDTWTATVDYGDGTGAQRLALISGGKRFALAHDFAFPGVYVVTVQVADDGGAVGRGSLRLTVVDLPPVVRAALDPVAGASQTFVAHGLAFDADRRPVTVAVDFGDGTPMQHIVPGADSAFTFTHTYARDGTFQVTVLAVDRAGAVTQSVFTAIISPATGAASATGAFSGLFEEHLQFAESEAAPPPAEHTADVVFASFNESSPVPHADTLTGNTGRVPDDGDDPFWPWLDRKVAAPPPRVKPAADGGAEKAAPDAPQQEAPPAPPASGAGEAPAPPTAATLARAAEVETPTPPAPAAGQAEAPQAERSWWEAAVGCILAVAGLLGLCDSREDRE